MLPSNNNKKNFKDVFGKLKKMILIQSRLRYPLLTI